MTETRQEVAMKSEQLEKQEKKLEESRESLEQVGCSLFEEWGGEGKVAMVVVGSTAEMEKADKIALAKLQAQ